VTAAAPTSENQANSPESAQQNQTHVQGTSVYDELKLTLDQKRKIAAVMDEQDRQLSEVRDDASLSSDHKKQETVEIREAGSSKINAILTRNNCKSYPTCRRGSNRSNRAIRTHSSNQSTEYSKGRLSPTKYRKGCTPTEALP